MSHIYIACAVDLSGTILAQQTLQASDDESAKKEAQGVLLEYPAIEVWQSYRWVARIVRRE
jgi:hypothetical protein